MPKFCVVPLAKGWYAVQNIQTFRIVSSHSSKREADRVAANLNK